MTTKTTTRGIFEGCLRISHSSHVSDVAFDCVVCVCVCVFVCRTPPPLSLIPLFSRLNFSILLDRFLDWIVVFFFSGSEEIWHQFSKEKKNLFFLSLSRVSGQTRAFLAPKIDKNIWVRNKPFRVITSHLTCMATHSDYVSQTRRRRVAHLSLSLHGVRWKWISWFSFSCLYLCLSFMITLDMLTPLD